MDTLTHHWHLPAPHGSGSTSLGQQPPVTGPVTAGQHWNPRARSLSQGHFKQPLESSKPSAEPQRVRCSRSVAGTEQRPSICTPHSVLSRQLRPESGSIQGPGHEWAGLGCHHLLIHVPLLAMLRRWQQHLQLSRNCSRAPWPREKGD